MWAHEGAHHGPSSERDKSGNDSQLAQPRRSLARAALPPPPARRPSGSLSGEDYLAAFGGTRPAGFSEEVSESRTADPRIKLSNTLEIVTAQLHFGMCGAVIVVLACAAQCSSFRHLRRIVRRFGMCGAVFVVLACAAQGSSFWHLRRSVRRFGMFGAVFVVLACAAQCSSFWHVRLSVLRFGMCV